MRQTIAVPQMQDVMSLDAVLRRDRVVVMAGVVALAALAWAYIVASPHTKM